MLIVYTIIHWIIQLFIILLIVQAILSFVVDPYNIWRRRIDNLINPFLNPIRRILPATGNLDFSPLVLIILLYLLDAVLQKLLLSIG